MSSISEELQRIVNAKASIKSAIESKGVNVSTDLKLSSYADKILEISAGGGGGSQADLNNIIDSLRSRGLDVPSNIGWSDVPYYIELLVQATDAESADSDFLISDQLGENEIWYKTTDNQPIEMTEWAITDSNDVKCNVTYNYYDPNSGYCKCEFNKNVYKVGPMFYRGGATVTAVVFSNYLREINELFQGLSQLSNIIVGRGLLTLGSLQGMPIGSISLPSGLTNISDFCFMNTNLYKIKCYATTAPTLNGTPFWRVPSTGTIYIPRGADYSTWRNSTGLSGWSFIDNL